MRIKKYMAAALCLALITALAAGCAPEKDPQVESVREQIEALPTPEQFHTMDDDSQLEAYNRTQAAYDAYLALSEKQQAMLSGAEDIFQALFSCFNEYIMPLDT